MTPLEYLSTQMAQARRHFEAQLGEASVCEVTKEGCITGGMKYAEGRLVALRNLERRVRTGEALESAVEAERTYWQALREQHTAIAWRAYAQGGLDACAECLSAFSQPS